MLLQVRYDNWRASNRVATQETIVSVKAQRVFEANKRGDMSCQERCTRRTDMLASLLEQ